MMKTEEVKTDEVKTDELEIIKLKAEIYDLFEAKGMLLIRAQEIDKRILELQQEIEGIKKIDGRTQHT